MTPRIAARASTTTSSSSQDWSLEGSERLSADEVRRLLADYQKNDNIEARNQVVQANLRLVSYFAARFRNRGLSRDELMSEGAAALLRATATFDTERGVSFATYAARTIEHSMRRAVGAAHQLISVPSAARRRRAEARRSGDAFFIRHGRAPGHGECEPTTNGRLSPTVTLAATPCPQHSDDDAPFDPAAESRDEAECADLRAHVREAVEKLDPQLAAIVSLRFGLESGSPRSWEEVAQMVGLDVREIKTLTAEALRALRNHVSTDDDDDALRRHGTWHAYPRTWAAA